MWMRACPRCGNALMKAALDFSIDCTCGWRWEGDPSQEMHLAAEGQVLYANADAN